MSNDWRVAVDIGNARIKLGLFPVDCAATIPEPARTLPLSDDSPELEKIPPWLAELAQSKLSWWISSVNRPATSRLIDWLRTHRPDDPIVLLSASDLSLQVRLERPDMVGIDRLVDSVAVNRLRTPNRSAVIVDVGSAITVDLLSTDGAFLGGAILPGIQMSARALHEFTDLLPFIDMSERAASPSPLGTTTIAAIESGLFWGNLGAIRELTQWLGKITSDNVAPLVYLTGGAAQSFATLLGPDAHYMPNLTLSGIALASKHCKNPSSLPWGEG
jgi:type III pantothenate kinase